MKISVVQASRSGNLMMSEAAPGLGLDDIPGRGLDDWNRPAYWADEHSGRTDTLDQRDVRGRDLPTDGPWRPRKAAEVASGGRPRSNLEL